MDKKTGFISNGVEEVFKEIQGVLAISYVLLIIIGMINEAMYFWLYDINIFEYSEIFDFLIAPFKKIEYLIILIFIFLVCTVVYWADVEMSQKHPKQYQWLSFGLVGKSWYGLYRLGSVLLTFIFLLTAFSFIMGSNKKNKIRQMEFFDIELVLDSTTDKKIIGKKIGSNSNFIFVLDQQELIQIVPIHSKIQQITLRKTKRQEDQKKTVLPTSKTDSFDLETNPKNLQDDLPKK